MTFFFALNQVAEAVFNDSTFRRSMNGGPVSQVARFNNVEITKFQLLTGLIFARIAEQTDDTNSSVQHKLNARLALNTSLQSLGRLELTAADSAEIESGLWELRAKLAQLGERF